jgi:hypothetical protein
MIRLRANARYIKKLNTLALLVMYLLSLGCTAEIARNIRKIIRRNKPGIDSIDPP